MCMMNCCISGLIVCAAMLLILTSPCALHGHQDRYLTIAADGNFEEIPSEYGPAYLKINDASDSGTPKVALQLGEKVVNMPECIAVLFVLSKGEKIRASASWYHDLSTFPPYINLRLPDGYKLLFNLKNGRINFHRKNNS